MSWNTQKFSFFYSMSASLIFSIAPANAQYRMGLYAPLNTNCSQQDFEFYVKEIKSQKSNENKRNIDFYRAWEGISYCGTKSVPILRKEFQAASGMQDYIKDYVMSSLERVGKGGKEALPEVIKALKNEATQYSAIRVVGSLGETAKPAIPILLAMLKDGNKYKRTIAAISLGQIGETRIAVYTLLNILKNLTPKEVNLGEKIAFALVEISKDSPEIIPELIYILQSSQNGLSRSSAAIALGVLGKKASEAVPYLKKMVTSEHDSLILANVALALLSIGEKSEEIATATTLSIINQDTQFRDSAWTYYRHQISERQLLIVKLLGDRMSNSIPVLISVLNSEEVRNANKLEAQIIAGRKEEFRERMLISEQVELQERIIQTLAEIGSPAKSAVPTLIRYIQSQNSRLSLAAIEAIGAIGSSAKVAILPLKEVLKEQVKIDEAGRLRQEEFDVRQILSLEALARIGETSIAVPSLLRILQADRSLIVQERDRTTIISSQRFIIYRIGKAFNRIGKAAIPYLISELKSTIPKKKLSAVYGLSQIDSLTPEAIDLLSIVVRDDKTDLDARRLAAYALERSNIDMQWFFDQNSLISSKKAACLTLDYFDDYTGQCISPGKNGGASLFDQIRKFFGG